MARKKVHIDKGLLEAVVEKIEGGETPPDNLHRLYYLVQQELDRQGVSVPLGSIMGRIKDYGITLKTKPGERGKYRRIVVTDDFTVEAECKVEKFQPTEEKNSELDLSPFTRRGIIVENVTDLLTSSIKDDDTNRAIMDAIVEIRETHQLPALSVAEFRRLKGNSP